MNGPEILRIVDAMHRDKGIPKDMIFEGIEQGMHLAARKHFGVIDQETDDIIVKIDRVTGIMSASKAGVGQPVLRCSPAWPVRFVGLSPDVRPCRPLKH